MARANNRGESLASKAFRVSCGRRDLLYVAGREVAFLLALREHGVVLPGPSSLCARGMSGLLRQTRLISKCGDLSGKQGRHLCVRIMTQGDGEREPDTHNFKGKRTPMISNRSAVYVDFRI